MAAHVLAVGSKGLALAVPELWRVSCTGPDADPSFAPRPDEQRAVVAQALASGQDGLTLRELVSGKRRACLVTGGLNAPAPYDTALSGVLRALVEAGLRPSRVAIRAFPGTGAPLLGRAAIRRYGEELTGELDVAYWPVDGAADPVFAASDVTLAVVPSGLPLLEQAFPAVHATLDVFPGAHSRLALARARFRRGAPEPAPPTMIGAPCDVALTTGCGAPWDATLEEALSGLRVVPGARTIVLAFSGDEGYGSAQFAAQFSALVEALEQNGELPAPGTNPAYAALHARMKAGVRIVLFAPQFGESDEGAELATLLQEKPELEERLAFCDEEPELWARLGRWYPRGGELALFPLGCRSTEVQR